MMSMASDMQGSEALAAQAHIWNHTFNFINSMSLKCAIQLNIPDIIHNHGAPMPLPNLVEALQINEAKTNSVYRLMRILTHSGFFINKIIVKDQLKEEGYVLAPPSFLLLKGNPFNMTSLPLMDLTPVLMNPYQYMSEWFKSGDLTPFEVAHGEKFWDYTRREAEFGALFSDLFNEAMASDSRIITSVVIDDCKDVFNGISSLVDVGGGTGTMAKAIADAFPQMKCIAFDLPHVVANLGGCNNFSFVAGDMFEVIPPADAVLLKWILHNWDDEECLKILKKSKAAVTQSKEKGGGKVIIIDMVIDGQKKMDDTSVQTQLFFDMMMMMFCKGKERDEKEFAKLFYDAGFSDYKITPILGLRSVIQVFV